MLMPRSTTCSTSAGVPWLRQAVWSCTEMFRTPPAWFRMGDVPRCFGARPAYVGRVMLPYRGRYDSLHLWGLYVVPRLILKAKFHYAIWSQTSSKLVADLQLVLDHRPNFCSLQVCHQIRTCLRPNSVMKFSFESVRDQVRAGSSYLDMST